MIITKKAIILGLIAGLILGVSLFMGTRVDAHKIDNEDNWSKCVSNMKQCNTDNGTQTETVFANKLAVCPAGYHLQNDGWLGQRCHRDHSCSFYHGQCPTEHVNPTYECPEGYTPSEDKCSLTITRECHTGIVQTDSCEPEPEATVSATIESKHVDPAPGEAPQLPQCEKPGFAPTAFLDKITFSGTMEYVKFHWTTVKDGLHTYWINFGTAENRLTNSLVVQGESQEIGAPKGEHIFMQVAGYDQGCVGSFSLTIDP